MPAGSVLTLALSGSRGSWFLDGGTARLGGPSLPLDVGFSDNVPAGIRNAVRLRDRHCQWSGGRFP